MVVADDFVPRLTVVSVKELHGRLANPELSSAANSALYAATVGPASAALSRQWESFAATQTGSVIIDKVTGLTSAVTDAASSQQAADVVDAVSTTLKRWKSNWFGPSVSTRGLGEAYSTLPSGADGAAAASAGVAIVATAGSAIEASSITSGALSSSSSSAVVAAVALPATAPVRDASDAGVSVSSADDDGVAPASPMLFAVPAAGAASIPPLPAQSSPAVAGSSGAGTGSGTGEPIYLGPDPPPLSFAEQRLQYFAEAYAVAQCSPEQRMVVPGAIYHVTRIPQPAAAAAPAAAGAASGPSAAAPQDSAGAAKSGAAGSAASAGTAALPAPISLPAASPSAVVAASHAPATPRTAHEISASVHSQVAATDSLRMDPKQDAPAVVADLVTAQAARGEYRVHLVPPSRLATVRISPTMWKDHSKRGALAICKALVTRQRCARGEVVIVEEEAGKAAAAGAAAAPAPADGVAAAIASAEAATRLLV